MARRSARLAKASRAVLPDASAAGPRLQDALPPEVLLLIFRLLPALALGRLARLCDAFKLLAPEAARWRIREAHGWPAAPAQARARAGPPSSVGAG